MATKDLFFDNKLKLITDSKNDVQYSNLNLNGTKKCSSVSSKSILNKNEKKIGDFNLQTNNHLKKWNKNGENLKNSEAITFLGQDSESAQKQRNKESDSDVNNSTLSLRISTYENSVPDSESAVAEFSTKKKNQFDKTLKDTKNNNNNLNVKASEMFEIPRQQKNQIGEPEIMQFKASQKLLNLHENVDTCQSASLEKRESREKAGADSSSVKNEGAIGIEPSYATAGMSFDKCDPEPLIKYLWGYLVGFLEEQPPPLYHGKPLLHILREAVTILQSEHTVIDLQGVVTIIGGVHGHGDSLMYHMSYSGLPPTATYIFLGNYVGEGFAPHECLFLLLALKVKFPKHIYLLKGCFEDPDVLKGHDFIGGLQKRGLMEDPLVWCFIEQIMHSFPLAAILNDSYLCISGGIGPELMKVGIPGLRAVQRPPTFMSHISITTECQWGCLKLPGDSEVQTDGSPMFTEEMVTKFCAENKLRMIIRSRQLVAEGILNFPEQMITLWTPVSFLDSFRNGSVSLRLNGKNHKASLMRYSTHDREAESLDDDKPPAGRNAMTL